MEQQYRHLSIEERAVIMTGHGQGESLRSLARILGRSASTICRELQRNRRGDKAGEPLPALAYDPTAASQAYRRRRQRCGRRRRLVEGSALYRWVHKRLVRDRWSPQQIAATLRRMPADSALSPISHEAIYAVIYAYPRGSPKQGMIEALRQRKPARGRRRTTLAKGQTIPEALRIVNRPEAVSQRLLPGHWEKDFIKGAFNRSAVGTLVERKTRFVVLARMPGCTAADALEGFSKRLRTLPAFMRQSLTYDRGGEMACHAKLAKRLNLDIWFADPYAPWQRGSNENTNGLLRQFLPKGTDLSTVSQARLNAIARLMNRRPRQTLGWRTPEEALADEMHEFSNRVALDS